MHSEWYFVWFLSFSVIHIVMLIVCSLLLMSGIPFPECATEFILSPLGGHVGSFQLLLITNKAVDIFEQFFV